MATKILGLDALEHIRDYIDGTSSNINYRIDNELKDHIVEKINEATTHIQSDYDSKYNTLIDRISFVEQNGTADELERLRLELEALQGDTENKFNALDGIERELTRLTTDYQDLYEGVTTGAVFNGGQLNEIINTAMINKVDISPDAILTPEMYAAKLVALIGNFGQINAANIIGGDIKGHTISSNNVIEGTEDPVWTIREAGDGWLAQKNISWDTDGNVTFGEGVKIGFDSVTGAEAKLQSLMSNYDSKLQTYVEDYVKNSSVAAVDRQMLQDAVDAAKADVDTAMSELETTLSNSIDGKVATANTALANAVSKVETYLGADYAVEGATLKAQLDAVKTAAEDAAKSGNEELAKQLNDLSDDLNRELNALNISYVEVRNSVKAIESDIQNMGGTALNQKGLEELLDASLIQSTTQTGDSIISPNVIAKKLIALVATFGTVNASRIVGTDIQGYTISSPRAKKDSEGNIIYKEGEYEYATDAYGNKIQAVDESNRPLWDAQGDPIYVYAVDANGDKIPVPDTLSDEELAWILRSDGSGHLANGNISWGKAGNVEFGPNVTIGWNDEWNEKIPEVPEQITDEHISNIATTTITKEYIESKEIVAKDIKGDTITGKTIQSSESISEEDTDPTWQITNDGAGYLAKKNITWESDGTLNANINGSFSGGNNGTIAGGALTWDDSAVKVHKNFVFDEGVGITWENITGTENIATKDDIQNAGLSDTDREKLNTVITKDSIQTDTLVADNLTVRNLNTKNTESLSTTRNVIVAKDNYLKVYNNVGNVATTLTSDNLIDFDVADGDVEEENTNDSNYVQQVKFEETGVSVWTHQTVQNLRFDIGDITFKQIGDNVESADISVSYGVRACSGSPSASSLTAWGAILPYGKKSSPRGDIQDGSFQILSSYGKQPKICLYKKLDDGTYESEPSYTQTETLNNNARTVSETFPASSSQDPQGRVKYSYDCSHIDINSISIPGTFKISIIFPRGSIVAKKDFDNYLRLSVNTTLTISKAFGDFVFIGKDGIIVNTDKNTFILNNDGTVLKSGTKSRYFGIKVTPSGMYFCNGGNTWRPWEPHSV